MIDLDTLKPGMYGCVHLDTWFGKLIDFFCYPRKWGIFPVKGYKKFNHSFLYIGSGMISEATPKGVHVSPISNYAGKEMIFNTNDVMTPEQVSAILLADDFCERLLVKYNFLAIAYLGLFNMGVNWGWLRNRVLSEGDQICSQHVAFCGVYGGMINWLCGKTYAMEVTPKDLADRCNVSKTIGNPDVRER